MKRNIHFWSFLNQFFLEREVFQTKSVKKIKTHILCSVTAYGLRWQKCVGAGQVQKRCDNRHKLKIFNTSVLLHGHDGYANAPRCYVIHTLPVLPPGLTSEQWLHQPYHWRNYTSNAFDVHWPKRNEGPSSVISIAWVGISRSRYLESRLHGKTFQLQQYLIARSIMQTVDCHPATHSEVSACIERRYPRSGVCCLRWRPTGQWACSQAHRTNRKRRWYE